ncbi:uncharacterized protein LOC131211948 isoform X2 [Anopheles bellator]|uniref:uncharacterized protein LOC131211948 isoform X2 n=1 Tax=Anopheles bellator TaxID=139047 RepID=UPI002647F705|nr:uncharacterized protein LOC131211948 isoform X2 [Anopheles bellator]
MMMSFFDRLAKRKVASESGLAAIFGLSSKPTAGKGAGTGSIAPKPIKVSDRYGPSNFRYIPSPATGPADELPAEPSKPPEWAIERATVVVAYKLAAGDNMFLGKVGLALLKSSTGHRLLLYRTKTDVLGAVTLNRDTKLFLKQDYLQFRADESSDFWSVLFENESDRQAMLAVIDEWCTVEREPVIEEPLSEAEKEPEAMANSRSNLVARMARMGQAIPLPPGRGPVSAHGPVPPPGPPDVGSDSSDTSDSKIETIPARVAPARRTNMVPTIGMQMVPLTGLVSASTSGPSNPATADMNFNLVMSENRMQNTEMRMNLTKLESKLDRVLDRIDLLSVQGDRRPSSAADRDEELLALEEKLLELKRENHTLKGKLRAAEATESDAKRRSDAKLIEKLQSLEECDHRQRDTIHRMERENETNRAESARQKEVRLALEKELAEAKENGAEKTKELERSLAELRAANERSEQLQQQLTEERNRSHEAGTRIEQLQRELNTVRQASEKTLQPAAAGALVKDIMNNCYQRLCDQITDPQVLRLIAATIKRETKAALDREKK